LYEKLELERIIKRRIKLYSDTKTVIFLCYAREAKVGFNNLGNPILREFNVYFFCPVRKKSEFSLRIAPPPLCILREIPSKFGNTQAFSVRTFNHLVTCPDSDIPSLKELEHLNLYMA